MDKETIRLMSVGKENYADDCSGGNSKKKKKKGCTNVLAVSSDELSFHHQPIHLKKRASKSPLEKATW